MNRRNLERINEQAIAAGCEPIDIDEAIYESHLRDQFAMAALSGILPFNISTLKSSADVKNAAEVAYVLADAMLKAREE